jgi:RNA-directed DNA polymerase
VLGKLLKKQEGKCSLCGGIFKTQDLIEIDHIVPQKLGGPKRMYNLQLLHRHCHHVKSSSATCSTGK